MQKENLLYSRIRFLFLVTAVLLMSVGEFRSQPNRKSASPTETKIRLVADSVLRDATFGFVDGRTGARYISTANAPDGAKLEPESVYNDWRYWNGVLNIAMLRLGEELGDSAYSKFASRNIEFDFDNYTYFDERYKDEDKWGYPFGQMIVMKELDDYGVMGASLIEVYKLNPQSRYRSYIDSAAGYIADMQGRLPDGTLARTFPRRWTIWADDLYMSVPLLARLGELTHDRRYFDDAANQVVNFNKYLFDVNKGLMYHCWYSDTRTNGVAFWGRANGWMMMAQVDLLDRLPPDHPKRDTLIALLRREIRGLVRYQDAGGLWHQVLDRPDSYLETSCSAMFVYAVARAVGRGYIESGCLSAARRGWEGVMSRVRSDGKIEGVCTGTGVGDDLAFYYDRPAPLNDIHGIGAVLLAGAEILKASR